MTDWTTRAACLGTDFTEWPIEDQVPMCAQCPVRAECLDYAIRQPIINGASVTYAGKTGKQLQKLKRRLR